MANLNKLNEIKTALNNKFFEREKEIDAILIALLSKQHMLMIGPAGTAKSALSMELSKIIEGSQYFQWLLTRFSTPEELFGPLSLKELENGVYKRNTTTKMPEAHLAFLDEIFKANSAILNSLLTLINERLFYNNGQPVTAPLMSVVGSSNEYPEEDEGLEALFDRFLLRFEIEYIKDEDNFIDMLKGNGQEIEMPTMSLKELESLQFLCEMVHIPEQVYSTLSNIRVDLRDEGVRPSDRRFKQSLSILQAKALLEQRQTVEIKDIQMLEHTLWENVEQKSLVSDIVSDHALDIVTKTIQTIDAEAQEILKASKENPSSDYILESNKKLKQLIRELEELKAKHPTRNDIDETIRNIKKQQQQMINAILEPIDV